MRNVGRITGWKDDKGFGFVEPHGGGPRVFVHVSGFQPGSRRPVDGDLVSYVAVPDGRGRSKATVVRFAGQRIEAPRAPRRAPLPIPRILLGSTALLCAVAAAVLGWTPVLVPIVYVLASILSALMYSLDKRTAQRGLWRTPEVSLHLADLAGGWPGGLIAQQLLRHKTAKASFQVGFWITVALNLAMVAWLSHGGFLERATRWLLG